jgi:peptidyl-prolyl cis-trans isomerase C
MSKNTKNMHLTSISITRKCITSLLTVLAICGLIAACGKKESAEKTSQSIVSVNGEDITFLQLNNELQRVKVNPEQQTQAEKQIVAKLVDRQILVQASIKDKLDRNPQVLQAIENAKMQILAQSYLENVTSSVPKPTDADIAEYRNNHADIFADRKVYVMDQLVFTEKANLNNELEALSDNAKTIEDVIKWLTEHQITYAQAKEAHSAESLPPEFLTKISKMAIGEIIFFKTNQRIMVSRMIEIINKPISEVDSKPIIERILLAQKRKKFAEEEISRLRTAAEITYINKKFAPSDKDSSLNNAKPDVSGKQNSANEPSVPAPVQNIEGDGKAADHIEKGISGL